MKRASSTPIMERALDLLQRGLLPENVSEELLWAALISIFQRVDETNGNVAKHDTRITRMERIVFGATAIGLLVVGAFVREIIGLFF